MELFGQIFSERQKVKTNSILKGAVFAAVAAVCAFLSWISYASPLLVVTGYILPVLLLFAFYRCSFLQAYLWAFLFYTNAGLIRTVYITCQGFFGNRYFEEFVYYPRHHGYSESLYLIIVYSVLFMILKYVSPGEVLTRLLNELKKALFAISGLEFAGLVILLNSGIGQIKLSSFPITLVSVIALILAILLLYVKALHRAMDTERNLLEIRNLGMEQQYEELYQEYKRYRLLVHDERHMIQYLQECIARQDLTAANRFLNGYQEEMHRKDNTFYTGIQAFDFLLNIKKRKIDEFKISFHLDFNAEAIPIADSDLIVILGNLLDNAIEATVKCPPNRREITLKAARHNSMFFIQIKNTISKVPVLRGQKFVTDKEDQKKHGWGVESVKHIVKKYGGDFSFRVNEESFEVLILINEE